MENQEEKVDIMEYFENVPYPTEEDEIYLDEEIYFGDEYYN